MKGIKTQRRHRGMTQQQLAKRIGVAQSTISMWEKGEREPRAGMLSYLAEAMNCAIGELYE